MTTSRTFSSSGKTTQKDNEVPVAEPAEDTELIETPAPPADPAPESQPAPDSQPDPQPAPEAQAEPVAAPSDPGTSQSARRSPTTASTDPAPVAITALAVAEKVSARAALATETTETLATETLEQTVTAGVATMTRVALIPTQDADPAPAVLPRLVTGILSSFGLSSPGTDAPTGPPGASVLLTLLALGSRRDMEQRALTRITTTSVAPVATAAPLAAAAVTAPATIRVGWLTGANSLNDTVNRFRIAGTDIGVMWDNGYTGDNPATAIVEQRQVLIAFGDTFSKPGMVQDWRNNVLFRSADNVLSNGLYVPNGVIHDPGSFSGSPMTYPNFSREIIGKYGYAVGPEVTIIPTAGISVPGAGANGVTRQYVNFMSVRSWDSPGRWTTNYSGIIWSDDNGQNWTVVPSSSIRSAAAGRSTKAFISGNQNFQQGAYVKPPAGSADASAGWVYSYGTPAGRTGTVYVSRVNEKQILDQTKYQYWNGSSWVANKPSAATPVLPGTTTSSFFGLIKRTTYPTVSEMSVQYNPYLQKYVMLYGDQNNNIVMRTSSTPQGGWSTPKTLVTSAQYPGLYAPMIHPWSGTTLLKNVDGTPEDPQMLYWNLSQWNEYNVALMRTDLTLV